MSATPRAEGHPLRIVCTDRGQHPRCLLAQYWHMVDGSDRLTAPFGAVSVLGPIDHDPDVPELAMVSTESHAAFCPRCGRNPQRADMTTVFAKVYDTRLLADLDISLIDW